MTSTTIRDVSYDPGQRAYTGAVTLATSQGMLMLRVTVPGPATWSGPSVRAALVEMAERQATAYRSA